MNLFDRITSIFKAPPMPAIGTPSMFQLTGRNTASSPRPGQGNIADSLSRYADEAWVYSAVRIIQLKGGEVPIRVYRVVEGKKTPLPDHPLQMLLDSVNPFMDRSQLMESTHGFKELAGNSFWLLDTFIGSRPTEIYPLNPAFVRPMVNKEKGLMGYEYSINGVVASTFQPEEIIHFRYWNPLDPFWGQPPISAGRDGADMIKRADQYNIAFFSNSAEAGGFLTTDKALTDESITRIKSAWAKNHQGARKAHKIEILHGGLEWKANTASHSEMMFPDLKRMSREDVLTCYMVPPVMVGLFDQANYSNADVQERIFWKFMKARFASIDSVLTERLGKPFDNVTVEHDLSGIQELQEDQKLKAERDRIHVTTGIKTINEVRAEMNLPPVEWGDVWYAPFGTVPVNEAAPDPISATPQPNADEPPAKELPAPTKKDAPDLPTPPDANVLRRDSIWQKYKGLTENHEKKWSAVLRGLFNELETEVINNLRDSDWQKTLNQNRLDKMRNIKVSIDIILFDRTKAHTIFRRDGSRLMKDTIEASANKEIRDYDLGIDFNIKNPEVVSWINTKAFKFSEEITATTEEALRRELTEAITNGETITQVEERIARVFDIARGSRTATIARTEVISASNEGAYASYKQSGVVDKTEWITSRDNRVREEHQIDGEQQEIGKPYTNGLLYPGDPSGEPGNVINCRCTVAPIVEKGPGE